MGFLQNHEEVVRTSPLVKALLFLFVLFLLYGYFGPCIPHGSPKKAQIDSEGKGNLMAIHAQLEMEKQLSANHSYPLQDCVGAQVVSPPTKLCPEPVCPPFRYTSEIGSENAKPDFCFIVTEIQHDPDDPNVIVGYTIQAQGRDGRVEGTVLQIDEQGKIQLNSW